jgi:hypothetical protein
MTYAIGSGPPALRAGNREELQKSYDRTEAALDDLDHLDQAWERCDQSMDALQWQMLAARTSLAAVVAQPDGEQAAALWQQAGEQVQALKQQTHQVGTQVATGTLPLYERGAETLYRETVEHALDGRATVARDSVSALEPQRRKIEHGAIRFAASLAQAAAFVGAPLSAAQAALAQKALDRAGTFLNDIDGQTDALHLGFEKAWVDGREFWWSLGDALDDKPPAAPTVGSELRAAANRVRQCPQQLREANVSMRAMAGAAAPLRRQTMELWRAVKELHKKENADVPGARERIGNTLDEMQGALAAMDAVPYGMTTAGMRFFGAMRFPTQRCEAMSAQLKTQDDAHRKFVFWGRQYQKVAKKYSRAGRLMKEAGFYIERNMGMATEIPHLMRQLRREMNGLRVAVGLAPSLGQVAVKERMMRIERLQSDLLATLPDPPPAEGQKKSMWQGLLDGAADRIEAALPMIESAAQEADRHGV